MSSPTCSPVREHFIEAAHLGLGVPGDRAEAAAATLREGGFTGDRTGARLWVDATAGRKLEAIDLVRKAGIAVLDFDLESDHSSALETPGNGGRPR